MMYIGKRRRVNPALHGAQRDTTFTFLDRKHVKRRNTKREFAKHFGILRGKWFR